MGVAVLAVVVGGLGLTGCVAAAPPTMGVATAGDGQAAVSWFASGTASAPATAYVVTPWIGFDRQTPVVFSTTATTQIVTGLTNGVSYAFTVHAVDANGDQGPESGMSNKVAPRPAPGAPLPPVQSLPQAIETPPPADVIAGTDHSGGYDFHCSPWHLQNSYVLQPATSAWWEYSCQSVWMPCHGICNLDWGGEDILTDYYYWDGSAPVYYGEWFYDGYWDQMYQGTSCDYWIDTSSTWFGPFGLRTADLCAANP